MTQTALSFMLDFAKRCRLPSTTHLSLKVTKKQHISNQISSFGEDTEDRVGHTEHIDEDHPIPMKSEAQRVRKTKHHLCPRRIRTHTQNSSFDWGDLWDSKRQSKDWVGGRCYPALFKETLFLDQTRFNPRYHSY